MNTKLSGAQLVLVPITTVGRNFLPYIEHINRRFIKFIDFAPAGYLPDTAAQGVTSPDGMYITIMDENGTVEIQRQLPLERLDYTQTLGVRQPIMSKIMMDSCYIQNTDAANVGKVVALVFWYDLEQYSARNSTKDVKTDSISILIRNNTRYNPLPDSDRLTGKRFRRILLGTPAKSPDMYNCVAEANMQNIYLTLCKGAYKVLADVPVMLLRQMAMLEKTEFQNIVFDFESSYLTVGGNGTITPSSDYVGKSVFFNLQYEA